MYEQNIVIIYVSYFNNNIDFNVKWMHAYYILHNLSYYLFYDFSQQQCKNCSLYLD